MFGNSSIPQNPFPCILRQPLPVGLYSFHLKQEGQSAQLQLLLAALTEDLTRGVY